MIKDLHQNLKQKYPKVFQPKTSKYGHFTKTYLSVYQVWKGTVVRL